MARMRKKKNLDVRMARCDYLLEKNPAGLKGRWREEKMPSASGIRLELGCGKGRFTSEIAERNPETLFIAVERVADALVVAMERCADAGLENVCFLCEDAAHLGEFFAPGEVDGIYLNFPDPWPAKRHARRRMVHEDFLKSYRAVLRSGGEIAFKTDNKPLFEFSLTQFPRAGYEIRQVTYDLHSEEPDTVMTDFETVFHEQGTKIYRCIAAKEEAVPEKPGEEPLQSLLDYWQEGDPVPRGMDEQALRQRARERQEAENEQNQ